MNATMNDHAKWTPEATKALRELAGWTQRELADWCGVTTETVIGWERKGPKGNAPNAEATRELDDLEMIERGRRG